MSNNNNAQPMEECVTDEDQYEEQNTPRASVAVDSVELNEDEVIEASGKQELYVFSINESRFDWWLKAIMIRYWVDFGNRNDYRVNWLRKTNPDDENQIVELIVQIFRTQNDDNDAGLLLFSTTMSIAERKTKVQGKYSDFWKNTEFLRLRDFVNDLQSHGDLDADRISADYAKLFQDAGTTEGKKLSHLDLSEVSWEVYLLCTISYRK